MLLLEQASDEYERRETRNERTRARQNAAAQAQRISLSRNPLLPFRDPDGRAASQERASVGAQWVFGLQHNMAPNAAPWRRAALEEDPGMHSMGQGLPVGVAEKMKMQTPFHYADPMCQADRLTLNTPIAYPGVVQVHRACARMRVARSFMPVLAESVMRDTHAPHPRAWRDVPHAQVNGVRIESDLYQITSYDAWPVVPNSKADWRLLNDWYYNTDLAGQERIKLFVGPVRLSLSWEYYDSSFGECSFNPETGRSWNLEAMLAYDKLFPGAVREIRAFKKNVCRNSRLHRTRR